MPTRLSNLPPLEGVTCRQCDPPAKPPLGALHDHLAEQHPATFRALTCTHSAEPAQP